jgi:hypothetical protein|nr:MAG TPA: hypothetical protein [Caudoviricetes sp.]
MTREEVKAQLDKCPLEWEDKHMPNMRGIYRVSHRSFGSVKIEYNIEEYNVVFPSSRLSMRMYWRGLEKSEIIQEWRDMLPPMQERQAVASVDLLEKVCDVLGIND